MHPRYELTGKRFGKLLVLAPAGTGDDHTTRWLVACDCGTEKIVIGKNLMAGHTRSCGCRQGNRDAVHGAVKRTHGMSKSPLYTTWLAIRHRCHNPKNQDYRIYGGRGIEVCREWRDSFEAFQRDMGPTWQRKLTIERKDVNGPYEPGNCTWIPMSEQAKNRRTHGAHGFDLAGQQFGDWTALRIGTPNRHNQRRWICRCVCGTEQEITTARLKNGKTTGCGCSRWAISPTSS